MNAGGKENIVKHPKVFTFTIAAVTTAAMLVGIGTASATLCKDKACNAKWETPTEVLVSSTETKLTAPIATVICESHATLFHEGENVNKKLFGKILLLDWTNCSGCTTVTTTTNGTFEDEATGAGNGRLEPLGTVVLLKQCPLGLECTASAINGKTILTLDGGTINGTALGLASTPVAIKGFGCGTSATWKAENPYVVLSVTDHSGTYTTNSIGIFQL